MNERVDRILREPQLLPRFDEADCYRIPSNGENERSQPSSVPDQRVNNIHRSSSNGVMPASDPNYSQLLFIALVDILCQATEPGDLNEIAKTLVQNGITSPICFSHQLHGLREHVRQAFFHLFSNAQKAVHFETSNAGNQLAHNSGHATASEDPLLSFATASKVGQDRLMRSSVVSCRYRRDFEELEQLGKGGFGAVFKVHNYIDGRVYAVKKINLDLRHVDKCFRALREVKSLAALTHPNIVRYHNSWLEFDTPNFETDRRATSGSRRVRIQEMSWESATDGGLMPFRLRHCLSSPDVSTEFHSNSALDDNGYHSSLPIVMEPDAITGHNLHGARLMSGTLVLYLQMELCSSTLRNWLNQRNNDVLSMRDEAEFDRFTSVDKAANKRILRQMLEALSYIHSQGIIHRDLKPSNIFLRESPADPVSPHVLLGDFGLSCSEKQYNRLMESEVEGEGQDQCNDDHSIRLSYRHSTGMGTFAYSAPEQLRSQFYDCKVDMFSFGIIAFEMYFPFFSYMERIHNIMKARAGELDETFQQKLPLQAAIIRQLVQKKPSLRPTARHLLEEETVFIEESSTINDLKKKLKEIEEELLKLRGQEASV